MLNHKRVFSKIKEIHIFSFETDQDDMAWNSFKVGFMFHPFKTMALGDLQPPLIRGSEPQFSMVFHGKSDGEISHLQRIHAYMLRMYIL